MFSLVILLASFITVSPVEAKSTAETVISMQLSWRHQFQFAGYYAAIEKGFYRDAGLEVNLLEGGAGSHCNEKVLRSVEYCNAPGSVVKQRIEGEKIVVLASIIQHSPIVLLTKKESGIYTPHDLIHKRVEMLLSGEPIPEIQAMFQNEGVSLEQIQLCENSVGIGALLLNKVDALYGFSSNELYQLRKAGIETNIINPRQYGIDFYGDALLTSEEELKNNPERVKKFLDASLKGWRYAMSHQVEIVDLILEKYSLEKSREDLLAEAKAIEALMLPNLIQIGHVNPGRWRHTADTLMSLGLIDPDYSLEGFIYESDAKVDYLSMIRFLIIGLVIMTLIMGILWFFNHRLSQEIAERTKVQDRLRKAKETADLMAYTDYLSGLGNRRAFYELGVDAMKLAKINNTPLSLIIIDIDYFKKINDQYGHQVGDEAICLVAKSILLAVRGRDIQGRIGGEEFAIMLPDTDTTGALELAERIRKAIEEITIVLNEECIHMTASLGVTTYNQTGDDINSLMHRADNALYNAKHSGRNQVVCE